jgi:O-antigen ligase
MIGRVTLVFVLVSVLPLASNRPMWWTLLSVGVMLLFTLRVFLDLRSGIDRYSRRALPLGLVFALVIVWALVQSLWMPPAGWTHPVWRVVPEAIGRISADPIAGLHHAMRLSAYAMVFWIATRHAVKSDYAEQSLIWIAVGISLLSAYGIVTVAISQNPILGERATTNVTASFINRNNFATYAVFGLLANLALYLRVAPDKSDDPNRQLRDFLEDFFESNWLYATGVLLCLGAILLSQSRAGAAAAGLGLAAFFLSGRRTSQGSTSLALAFSAALIAFSFMALSSGVLTRIFVDNTEEARFLIYPLVIDGILDRPLLGHGLGAFQDAFRIYVTADISMAEVDLAHSSYLENAFELGLPATAVFYGCLVVVILVILRGTFVRSRNRQYTRFAFAAAIAGGFHSAFDFSLQMPASAALFAFILGMGWSQAFPRQRNSSQVVT